MGQFLNSGNQTYREFSQTKYFVDKTRILNKLLEKDFDQKFICCSRPRRFGKSVTANMLTAYFSKGADSRELFAPLKCRKDDIFVKNMNQYDTIFLDIQAQFVMAKEQDANPIRYIRDNVIRELKQEYPDLTAEGSLAGTLDSLHAAAGNQFVIIFDEWDYPIRELSGDSGERLAYIEFLRALFKSSAAQGYVRLAYLTGILPVIRAKGQSAVNNFDEYTMLDARDLGGDIGFVEEEVTELCEKHGVSADNMKYWYDGYNLDGIEVYNPLSVIRAVESGYFEPYWTETGTYEDIRELININMDGLTDSILLLLAGEKLPVNVRGCRNDMHTFANKDHVLTTLVHLGYLAYDRQEKTVRIPNREIQEVFEDYSAYCYEDRFTKFAGYSQDIVNAIRRGDTDMVAQRLELIHNEFISSLEYNDENSLSCVVIIAMLASIRTYHRSIREFPCGKGFADQVYIPLDGHRDLPVIIVELKCDQSARTALTQIREKRYPDSLKDYSGKIILVGIHYDRKTKEHTCAIEKIEK